MFLNFYGLREQPFGVTPDPRFLYMSETHREALASLFYGIKTARGFLALVAKPGMGKTSLLFRLMQNLEATARTVFLFQTQCDSREFLRYLLTDMGIPAEGQDLVQMHTRLNEALIENAKTGKQFVVIIDEAQNLDNNVLETVRLLSDFETPRNKLMQIILAGQPQLGEKLAHPSLTQLSQRVSIMSRLKPFTREETAHYIDYRLQIAGHTGNKLFTPAAVDMIADQGQGIPRNINNLCFNALSWSYAMKKARVDVEIVREVAAELAVNCTAAEPAAIQPAAPPASKPASEPEQIQVASVPAAQPAVARTGAISRWAGPIAALAAVLIVAMLFWFNSPRGQSAGKPEAAEPISAAPAAAPAESVPPATTPESSLVTPGSAAPANATAPAVTTNPSDMTVVVRPQDTLWQISQRYLGQAEPETFKAISQMNPELKDLDHIEVGQHIRLPRSANAADAQAGAQQNQESSTGPGRERP
jgi:general secretion pathway protein A